MKYIIFLLAWIYIIWWFFFINFLNKWKKIDIQTIKDSLVIIIPKNNIIEYNKNPKWIINDKNNFWIWVWFFIDNNWLIQTVNHIIEYKDISYNILYKNKKYDFQVISRDIKNDLAILKINIKNKNFLKITNWKIWEKIYSFWIDKNYLNIIYNTWIILNSYSDKTKLWWVSNLFEISNILKPWFSGWPIINKVWKVIWINYAISDKKNYWIKLFLKFPQ